MGNPNVEQGRWQSWKWVVYTSACYALHVILVSIHVILLVLHKYRSEKTVTIPPNTPVIIGVTVILQTFGIVYGVFLVWLTQQLALRRDLLRDQTLTAIHDKAGAWSGLGAALSTFVEQFKTGSVDQFRLQLTINVTPVIWLASHHTEIQEVVKTKTPQTSELRRIGLHVTTTFGEVSEPTKGSNTP
ncbi:hypothetical protein EDC04DRAFT_2610117 [Pisolithus marmoratus]|nr:hypothetical protein EDC04DRAFT_2610117 [Pisolithus marmoratus]